MAKCRPRLYEARCFHSLSLTKVCHTKGKTGLCHLPIQSYQNILISPQAIWHKQNMYLHWITNLLPWEGVEHIVCKRTWLMDWSKITNGVKHNFKSQWMDFWKFGKKISCYILSWRPLRCDVDICRHVKWTTLSLWTGCLPPTQGYSCLKIGFPPKTNFLWRTLCWQTLVLNTVKLDFSSLWGMKYDSTRNK